MHNLKLSNQTYSWVNGHQDHKVPFECLDQDAKYNVKADELANAAIATYKPGQLKSSILPHAQCNLRIE